LVHQQQSQEQQRRTGVEEKKVDGKRVPKQAGRLKEQEQVEEKSKSKSKSKPKSKSKSKSKSKFAQSPFTTSGMSLTQRQWSQNRKKPETPTPSSYRGLPLSPPLSLSDGKPAAAGLNTPRQGTGQKRMSESRQTKMASSGLRDLGAAKTLNSPKSGAPFHNLLKAQDGKRPSASEVEATVTRAMTKSAQETVSRPKSHIGMASGTTATRMGGTTQLLKGLERAAMKKLNKHSSSLDHTDWVACYEKLRKDLGFNSPKGSSGRMSTNSIRPSNQILLLSSYHTLRPLATPTAGSHPTTTEKRPEVGGSAPKPKLEQGEGDEGLRESDSCKCLKVTVASKSKPEKVHVLARSLLTQPNRPLYTILKKVP
jgi:hypothetical protein